MPHSIYIIIRWQVVIVLIQYHRIHIVAIYVHVIYGHSSYDVHV
jgi:hypothetical protein